MAISWSSLATLGPYPHAFCGGSELRNQLICLTEDAAIHSALTGNVVNLLTRKVRCEFPQSPIGKDAGGALSRLAAEKMQLRHSLAQHVAAAKGGYGRCRPERKLTLQGSQR